jgi:hypothetical protein
MDAEIFIITNVLQENKLMVEFEVPIFVTGCCKKVARRFYLLNTENGRGKIMF